MSIATLKRKSKVLYNNLSVGSINGGFSLNGTHRNQGYVGQTSLSRHLSNTPMRGNTPRGAGGCCGTYKVGTIVQSGVNYLNDPNVVKSSVLDNRGSIRTHYRWIWRPQPFSSTKPDTTNNNNTQQSYIESLSANVASVVDETVQKNQVISCGTGSLTSTQRPRSGFGFTRLQPRQIQIYSKPESATGAISQNKYTMKLGGLCTQNNKLNQSATNNAPLPGN